MEHVLSTLCGSKTERNGHSSQRQAMMQNRRPYRGLLAIAFICVLLPAVSVRVVREADAQAGMCRQTEQLQPVLLTAGFPRQAPPALPKPQDRLTTTSFSAEAITTVSRYFDRPGSPQPCSAATASSSTLAFHVIWKFTNAMPDTLKSASLMCVLYASSTNYLGTVTIGGRYSGHIAGGFVRIRRVRYT